MIWEDASAKSYTAESTVIDGNIVTVCLDDEAVYEGSHAYYWDVVAPDQPDKRIKLTDGWASSVARARAAAIAAARNLT